MYNTWLHFIDMYICSLRNGRRSYSYWYRWPKQVVGVIKQDDRSNLAKEQVVGLCILRTGGRGYVAWEQMGWMLCSLGTDGVDVMYSGNRWGGCYVFWE